MQLDFFDNHIEDLKKGVKTKCPVCEHEVRWYKKTLCKRLVQIAYEIYNHTDWEFKSFSFRDVFEDDHLKVADAQKLKYWGLIKKLDNNGWWKITMKGMQFLKGNVQVPKAVWVYNNKVQMENDEMVHIGNVEPRWQTCKADHALDYAPQTLKI